MGCAVVGAVIGAVIEAAAAASRRGSVVERDIGQRPRRSGPPADMN